ncbi:MAG: hypothetical protein MI684_04840 [Chlorobiales bacterium]|nr:hypothetical protein [Chlorobiales bacterium]
MSINKRDVATPDKYDLFIQRIDQFQSLVEKKKELQDSIARVQSEYEERIRPIENELAVVIKKLDQNLSKLEAGTDVTSVTGGYTKYGRGQLGEAIKNLLRSNPSSTFKPKEIADALNTKGTAVSLWFNKYGTADPEIERIPAGKGGKRFVYKIK